jgi:SAM-dependent methyltransferase
MAEKDYILGTHDAEIERLGLQHRVWRPRMLDAWRRGGIADGQTVIDIGCGPGFATIDLAEIVGNNGRVIGLERSGRFLDHLRQISAHRGLANIELCELDLDQDPIIQSNADAAWCRWLLSFTKNPAQTVSGIAASLRTGGTAIFHEYLDYRTWRLGPNNASFANLVDAVMQSWRQSGGEPDIGLQLPEMISAAGMEIIAMQPLIDVVGPKNFVWEWPDAFARINAERLIELGFVDAKEAEAALAALDEAKQVPGSFMVTPCVLEIIARKL